MVPKPMTPLPEITEAGGAYVRRRFTFGDRNLGPGDILSAEELASIPVANRRSLKNLNMIELFPKSGVEAELRAMVVEKDAEIERLTALLSTPASPPPTKVGSGDCFIMAADEAGKTFHIIQGHQVTDEPLSRAKAAAKMKELTS